MTLGAPPTLGGVGLDEPAESLFARDHEGRLIRVDAVTAAELAEDVTLTIDGLPVTVKKAVPATDSQGNFLKDAKGSIIPRATTIHDAAAKLHAGSAAGNPIPILCHRDHLNPAAVCRVCVVEVSKVKRGRRQTERKLLPACQHRVEDTMEIQTAASPNDPEAGERIRSAVRMLVELQMADHPSPCAKERETGDCELESLAGRFEVGTPRFGRRPADRGRDDSSPVIAVDHDACILCDRCVRACNDVRDNRVIGRMGKGYATRIAFDLDDPMGKSSCVACGECMVSCPTGALTHRAIVQADPWKGATPAPVEVTARELFDHPIPEVRRAFAGVAPAFLHWNARAVVRRHFKRGEVIHREGEFGSTAFLIERGSVEISSRAAEARAVAAPKPGLLARLLGGPGKGKGRGGEADPRAPVRHRETMGAGGLFGETSCMNFYPHSETVRAAEDCTLLEILRNVLYLMQRDPSFRAELERNYRDRAIDHQLRDLALFAPLRADPAAYEAAMGDLRHKIRFRRCEPGEVIFGQGDPATDGFFLVRAGFVKVARSRLGADHVLRYVGPGGSFGEVGLLSDLPEIRTGAAPVVRPVSTTALDHVELVRIGAEDFRDFLGRFPDDLRASLIDEIMKSMDEHAEVVPRFKADSLDAFLGQGLMNAQSLLVLDLERCTRCDECTKACADAHDGVTRLIRDGLRIDKYLVASSCRSCLDPLCMVGCPVGSIRRRDSLEIIIEDWCIGCGKCAENCPYGNINMHPFPTGEEAPDPEDPGRMLAVVRQKATTCDLCRDLGPDAEPSCVYACPHDAAHRMSGPALFALIDQATRF